jgi:hypothetical protein
VSWLGVHDPGQLCQIIFGLGQCGIEADDLIGALAEKFGPSYGLLWKTGVVLLGFPASYFFVQQSVWPGLGLIVLLLLLTLISKKKPVEKEDKKDLFKECC